jgi:predicted ATPase
LILGAAERGQVWVVSHSPTLVDTLRASPRCTAIELHKPLGETEVANFDPIELPRFSWPPR